MPAPALALALALVVRLPGPVVRLPIASLVSDNNTDID